MTQRYKLLGHFVYSELSENSEESKYFELKIYTFKYKFLDASQTRDSTRQANTNGVPNNFHFKFYNCQKTLIFPLINRIKIS